MHGFDLSMRMRKYCKPVAEGKAINCGVAHFSARSLLSSNDRLHPVNNAENVDRERAGAGHNTSKCIYHLCIYSLLSTAGP